MTEQFEAEPRPVADAASDLGKAVVASAPVRRMRERARDLGERAQELRARADELKARAQDLAERARSEVMRRRSAAADNLENLAGAVRPDEEIAARVRRQRLVVGGGSTLAIVAAVGAGVALGVLFTRRRKQRLETKVAAPAVTPEEKPVVNRLPETDPTAFANVSGGLPH
jgi:hypothetical protein